MPRKAKLILNPMADMGNAWKVADDLRPIVAEYGTPIGAEQSTRRMPPNWRGRLPLMVTTWWLLWEATVQCTRWSMG